MVTHFLFVVLYLTRIVQGSTTCPPPTNGQSRNLWSILWLCALTLLICVWHAIHPDVPPLRQKWYHGLWKLSMVGIAIGSFLLPEWTVYVASKEWWAARNKVNEFRAQGYKWTMMHSQFAEMGGFVYCEGKDSFREIGSSEFLRLCKENKIANPAITERQIKDKSKSDALGKSILAIQLVWFMLQVIMRLRAQVAVTLVELDTACMAVLTIILFIFWHNKPLRSQSPHIFYSRKYLGMDSNSSNELDEKGTPNDVKPVHFPSHEWFKAFMKVDNASLISLCVTWLIFGGLHLAAWNYPFPTASERIVWQVASFFLAISPIVMVFGKIFTAILKCCCWELLIIFIERVVLTLALSCALLCRLILVFLMFASLRSLPCSAYETVVWTSYIPHF